MTESTLTARAAFAHLPHTSGTLRGVFAADRDGLGLATVLVRKGQRAALQVRVRERFGLELPAGPRRSAAGDIAFAATGPATWLATSEEGDGGFAASLQEILADVASIADQSSGYAVLRLTGPRLRDTLAKILPIDLHERAFPPGAVASTAAGHVATTLWRLPDGVAGSPVFEFAMFRSLAGSFWHALAISAAEYGLVVLSAGRD